MVAEHYSTIDIPRYELISRTLKRAVASPIVDDPALVDLKIEGEKVLVTDSKRNGQNEGTVEVPISVAFERIINTTYEDVMRMKCDVDESVLKAKRWLANSMVVAIGSVILFQAVVIGLNLFIIPIAYWPLCLAVMVIGTICMKICFRRSRAMSMQMDSCAEKLLAAQDEYETVRLVLELDLSERTRSLLEKILISKFIGIAL